MFICPICGSKRVEKFLYKNEMKRRIDYLFCCYCKIRFIHSTPNIDGNIRKIYDEDALTERGRRLLALNFQEDSVARSSKQADRRKLGIIAKYKAKGNILDIGCNVGWFLKIAESKGYFPFGVEISKIFAEHCKEKLELNVFCGTLAEAKFTHDFFDIVRLGHVLEHIQNPLELLYEVKRIIKKDGIIVIETPNAEALEHKIGRFLYNHFQKGKTWAKSSLDHPNHLYAFSPFSMKFLCNKVGLHTLASFAKIKGDKTWFNLEPDIDEKSYIYGRGYFKYIMRLMYFLEKLLNKGNILVTLATKW